MSAIGIQRVPWLEVASTLNLSMYFSIRAKVSVLHREVGRSWEGPLREAPLYGTTPMQSQVLSFSYLKVPT